MSTIHIFVLQQGEGGNNSTDTQAFAEAFAFVEGSFGASLQLHPYRYEDVAPFINDHTDFNDGSLKTPGNYVRFLLPEKLSSVERALWLDSDTLVTGDVVPFLEKYGKEKALAAVPPKIRSYS